MYVRPVLEGLGMWPCLHPKGCAKGRASDSRGVVKGC